MKTALSLKDYEHLAKRILPRCIFGFAAHGAEDEQSLRANTRALADLALRPKVLVDISTRSQTCELWGRRYTSPFGIAPMGGAALFGFRADLALAEAAATEGLPFILSAASSVSMEQLAQQAPGSWYQAYLQSDRQRIELLLERLQKARYEVLVVTADVPVAANRENDLRLGFGIPIVPSARLAWDGLTHPRWLAGNVLRTLLCDGMPHFENFGPSRAGPIVATPGAQFRAGRDRLSWSDFDFIRRLWKGRLLLKGVLHPDDAARAVAAGADGIVVSNHGGRQLDTAMAPMRALPKILAVAGDAKVIVDGGFRRGSDVLKALALGADFVLLGRPMLYAAAVGGGAAVRHAIGLLRTEIDRDLALLGLANIADINRSFLGDGDD